jgi:predicted transcriptional regulator
MMGQAEGGLLQGLGVDAPTEDLYRAILMTPGATLSELKESTGRGRVALRRSLAELERTALVSRTGTNPTRFQAAPPDLAIEALASAREDDLNRARLAAHQLASLLHPPPEQHRANELIEILTTRTAVATRWTQLQTATHTSLEVFVRPPLLTTPAGDEALQTQLGERGVTRRAVYDSEALQVPGTLDHIQHVTSSGTGREQARVVSRLPMKLALFDRRSALVPLSAQEGHTSAGVCLVIHRSSLLEALTDLFDTYWLRGTDVRRDQDEPPNGMEDKILVMLAAGMKDEAIARDLGVSTATVRRRINQVMARLGVTTRFQVGMAIGRERERNAERATGGTG